MSSLYEAAKNGDMSLIQKLRKSEYVNTGLLGAAETGNLTLVKYFIEELGAWDINNALYYACIRCNDPNKELIKYLISFNGIEIISHEKVDIYERKVMREYLKNNGY